MDFWAKLQIHKWPLSGWILLYVICLLILYKNRKKWEMEIQSTFLFVLFSIALFLCPIFAKLMTSSLLPGYAEYERLTWLMFIGPVCAYTIVRCVSDLERKKRKIAVAIVLLLAMLISNSTFLSRDYTVAENLLKIPSSVADISQMIIDDAGCYTEDGKLAVDEEGNWIKPKVLVQEEQNMGYIGNTLYHGIRQYTSALILNALYYSTDVCSADDFDLSYYGLMDYQYFVCANSDALCTKVRNCGFSLLYESEDYMLFKNMRECTVYFVRHGQTDADVLQIYAGNATEAMLTEEGKSQALYTGESLSDVDFSAIYTSERTRTKDTAKLIMSRNKNTIPELSVVWQLDDIDWGKIEGLTEDEVFSIYPDYNEDAYIGNTTDTSFVSPIGATSKASMIYCLRFAMAHIASNTDGNALVVGHSSMIWYLQSLFGDQITENTLDNASITVLHYDKGDWSLECINESAESFEL